MSQAVRRIKTAQWKRAEKELRKLLTMAVTVGAFGAEQAEKLAAHELGTDELPERPVLRQSMAVWKKKRLVGQMVEDVLAGKTAEQALRRAALKAEGAVKDTFREGDFAPLAPATVARKGSEVPLIDTGRLRQSITHEIVPAKRLDEEVG